MYLGLIQPSTDLFSNHNKRQRVYSNVVPETVYINAYPTVTVYSTVICASKGQIPSQLHLCLLPATIITLVGSVRSLNPGDMPSFQASVPGTNSVSISDGKSCTASASGTLYINANPTVTVISHFHLPWLAALLRLKHAISCCRLLHLPLGCPSGAPIPQGQPVSTQKYLDSTP
jgi:hypothetical protein